jgi:hypothetical protein
MKPLLFLVMIMTLAGCARPGDHPISSNCVWIEEDSRSLNLATTADRRHLRHDAVSAEDMSIRWADKYFGHTTEYDRRQNECMELLFSGLGKHHGVDVALIRQYSLDRDIVVDSAVFLGFGVLYAVGAYIFVGRIRRRFPPGEPGFWLMTLTMAIGVSLIGVMVGNLGSIVIETVRLNSVHLSYRMNRIPWRQYWAVLFVSGFIIFGLAALIRSGVVPARKPVV